MKLQIVGMNQDYTDVVVRGDNKKGRSFSVFYVNERTILAADCINRPKDFMLAKKLILQGVKSDPETLANESIELMTLIQ